MKKNNMFGKAILVWFLSILVTGGLMYLLSENRSLLSSLGFGAVVGVIAVCIYIYQHKEK